MSRLNYISLLEIMLKYNCGICQEQYFVQQSYSLIIFIVTMNHMKHILMTFRANALITSKDFAVNYLKPHECISFSTLLM